MEDGLKQLFSSTVKIVMSSLTGGWVGFATQSIEEGLDLWRDSPQIAEFPDSNLIILNATEALYDYSQNQNWSRERAISLGQLATRHWRKNKPTYSEMAEYDFDQKGIVNHVMKDCGGLDVEDVEPIKMIISISVAHILKFSPPEKISAFMQESLSRSSQILEMIREQTKGNNEFEKQYRLILVRKLSRVNPYGAPDWLSPISYDLTSAYVMMRGVSTIRLGESSGADVIAGSIDEILPHGQRFLVSGDAGYGKTTLLKWIAIQIAQQKLTGYLSPWNFLIPFYVQLRDYQERLPLPEEFPKNLMGASIALKPTDWVTRNLQMGSALLLIDGLDEVPASKRSKVHAWIEDILLNFKSVKIVIASRPAAVPSNWVSDLKLIGIDLAPMGISSIEQVIKNWFSAIREERGLYFDSHLEERISRLVEVVLAHHRIRNLAANPALCTLLCRVVLERAYLLPSTLIELIEAGLETFLGHRDIQRSIEPSYRYLSYGEYKYILGQLAYWMVRNGKFSAEESEVKQVLGPASNLVDYELKSLLAHLKERVGILSEDEQARLEFRYLAFRDYLAAETIIDMADFGLALQNAHHFNWRGTFVYMTGLAPPSKAREIVFELLKLSDSATKNSRYLKILAIECSGNLEQEPNTDLDILVKKILSQVTPPQDMAEATAIATVGEVAIPFLRSQHKQDTNEVAACVRTLYLIGTPRSIEALKAYGNDSRAEVSTEFLRSIE